MGTRCISLLLAFMFLLGPSSFNTIANADVSYTDLSRATWSQVDTSDMQLITIIYNYDTNGSLVSKTTWDADDENIPPSSGSIEEQVTYQSTFAVLCFTNCPPAGPLGWFLIKCTFAKLADPT